MATDSQSQRILVIKPPGVELKKVTKQVNDDIIKDGVENVLVPE